MVDMLGEVCPCTYHVSQLESNFSCLPSAGIVKLAQGFLWRCRAVQCALRTAPSLSSSPIAGAWRQSIDCWKRTES